MFWNTFKNSNKSNINKCISEIIIEKSCDIALFAEYPSEQISKLCNSINLQAYQSYKLIPSFGGCSHICGLISNRYKNVTVLHEDNRYAIYKIEIATGIILIAAIHNVSKMSNGTLDQLDILQRIQSDLINQETKFETKNSIIVGDFNINPFEEISVSSNSLFAIPYREELKNTTAVRQGVKREKFFNPSWKFLSNQKPPYASYYYSNSSSVNYYWNMFDQVIIRPELVSAFNMDVFSIITETKTCQLMLNGKPNKNSFSDHLPIFFNIKEEKING